METDKDGDGWRWRQTKMKEDTHSGDEWSGSPFTADDTPEWRRQRQTKMEADEDRLTLGTSEVAASLQLTTPQSNEDGTWYFSSHAICWLPCPWRMQQSLQPQVQLWNRPSPLISELAFRKVRVIKRWQSHLVVPTGLTEDQLQNFWHYSLKWMASCFLHSWQSSVPKAYICLCSVESQHIWLADHIKQTVNTIFVDQSFHNIPSHSITFQSEQIG